MIAGAFAPDRHPSAAGAPTSLASFTDLTPKQPSRLCVPRPDLTAELFTRLDPQDRLILQGAQVLTMNGREILPDHDVVVQGGRIAAIRPTGGPLDAGARVIEAAGCTVFPGLSDVHTHLFTPAWARAFAPILADPGSAEEYVLPYELSLFVLLANGITRTEVLAGCPDALWMRDRVAQGSVVGPSLTVASPLVDGCPPLHSPLVSYQVGDYAGGQRAAELMAELGYDFAKPYSALSEEAYAGLVEGCTRRGIRLMGHVPSAVGPEAAIRAGQHGLAHVSELFYYEPHSQRGDSARITRLIDLMAEREVWLQATVTVLDRIEALCGTRQFSAPDERHMNPLHRAMWSPPSPVLATAARPERRDAYEGSYALACTITRQAHEAGVRVLTGTDCPNPYIVEGFSLHEELQRLVDDCMLDPHDVLYASTRQAARYHGEDTDRGVIRAGARADLVCVRGDPLKDIRHTRAVEAVIYGETLLTQSSIRVGMARVQRYYADTPIVTFHS